jgi:hypothetical protein
MEIYYFSSLSTENIRHPPQIPLTKGIQVDDLYIHASQKDHCAWRCTSVEPTIVWEKLPQETQEPMEDGKVRLFVITKTGLPGWVVAPTIARKYGHGTRGKTTTKGKGKALAKMRDLESGKMRDRGLGSGKSK